MSELKKEVYNTFAGYINELRRVLHPFEVEQIMDPKKIIPLLMAKGMSLDDCRMCTEQFRNDFKKYNKLHTSEVLDSLGFSLYGLQG